jgi:hypothetical protein
MYVAALLFDGSGFELGAEDVEEQLLVVPPIPAHLSTGASIDLSAYSVIGRNDGNFPSRGSWNGSSVLVKGPMWFTTPTVILGCGGASPMLCRADAPFAFRGHFTVTDVATGALLFTGPFAGMGHAHGTVWNDGSNASNQLVLSYTFNAAPVPEPASILLVTSGLSGLLASGWTRRRAWRTIGH